MRSSELDLSAEAAGERGSRDRLTITKSSDGVSSTIGYDNYGRVTSKNDGATTTTYGYDPNDRVNSIVHKKSSDNSVLHQESYNYDPANNLNWKLVNSVLTSYTYDLIDQLKTESSSTLSASHVVGWGSSEELI